MTLSSICKIFSVWFCLNLAWAAHAEAGEFQGFDLVLDIDETTFGRYVDPADTGYAPDHHVLDARGRMWRVLHGLPEALLVLEKLGARVSFFSAYFKPDRNPQILRALELPDGRTAWDLCDGRVIGANDLEYRGSQKVKDLRLVDPNSMERTVLVDNEASYAHPEQKRNLLWLPTHNKEAFENADIDRFDIVAHLVSRHQFRSARTYLAKIESEYLIDENKPVVMLGILITALEKSETEYMSLRRALRHVQEENFGATGNFQEFYAKQRNLEVFLEIGLEAIRKHVDPAFEKMGHDGSAILEKLAAHADVDVRTMYHEECQVLFGGKSYK